MRVVDGEIDEALARGGGALRVADHPRLRRSLQRRVASGELAQVWPGVLVRAADRRDPEVAARAVCAWQPDAVLTGAIAARLTFWPELAVPQVTASVPVHTRIVPQPYRLCRERLPPELVLRSGGLAVTTPALTALDLVATRGGAGIDEVLRRRVCRLADLRHALELTPGRMGNGLRRVLVHESRDEPWSEAERLLHALLRGARLSGWRTNHAVRCSGAVYLLDVAFAAARVAIEFDGFDAHTQRTQFHVDRRRWTDLQAGGWLIVHVSWDQLTQDPGWVIDHVRDALARSARAPQLRSA